MSDEAARNPEGTGPVPSLRLRRLKIHRWRSVLPGTELTFGDGVHALLGKNGTGKTTLLRLASMCVRGDFSGLESESFDIEYDLEWAPHRLSLRITNESAELTRADQLLESLTSREKAAASLAQQSYCFTVLFAGGAGEPVRVEGTQDRLTVNGDSVPRPRDASPFLPQFLVTVAFSATLHLSSKNRDAAGALTAPVAPTALLKAGIHLQEMSPFRFDEAEGMLHALEGSKAQGQHGIPPLEVDLVQSTPPKVWGPWIPDDLRVILEAQEVAEPASRSEIVVSHTAFPLLRRYASLAGFKGATMVLSFQGKTKRGKSADSFLFGEAKFFVELASGDVLSHEHLSFGQRRLLAFLYYASCNRDVLIVDELTNGLHHEWIAACADELAKRQSFVATQNPLLLDYLPVSSAGDAETAFIQCRLVDQDGKQWMHWRNTSPDEAQRFWTSYETGVQFISEILRSEGLW